MSDKKYIVKPGLVISMNDGDEHYIDAQRLMELYGVRPDECYVIRRESDLHRLPTGLKVLRPRYDGEYRALREDE